MQRLHEVYLQLEINSQIQRNVQANRTDRTKESTKRECNTNEQNAETKNAYPRPIESFAFV